MSEAQATGAAGAGSGGATTDLPSNVSTRTLEKKKTELSTAYASLVAEHARLVRQLEPGLEMLA
eukprot:3992541-Pleurochrysis_carterae.AAC.1